MIGDRRCTAWVVYRHAAALFYVPIRPVTPADRGGAMPNGFIYFTLLGTVLQDAVRTHESRVEEIARVAKDVLFHTANRVYSIASN